MTFLVATNVVASRLPERRPTGMPQTRAKRNEIKVRHMVNDKVRKMKINLKRENIMEFKKLQFK